MSRIYEVKCDHCGKREAMAYNGEHWLTPKDWAQLYDDKQAKCVDEHLCPECRPKKVKK
jgi:hypothetical protein